MNKEVDAYKIFRQLEERSKRANPYTFYDKDELIDEILKLEDELDQLTNNWNELEKYIIENKDYYGGITSEDVLDKMKEINGDKE